MPRLRDALARPGLAAIAEVKRRSPSAGDLRPDADPGGLASEFEVNGAAAVSILVDARFGGSLDDLRAARAASKVPLLAKGFFTSEADLDEIRRAGADAALLILRDLDDGQAAALLSHAASLDLEALVEAHNPEELERAARLGADPIGINARDLATFRIDRRLQLELVGRASRDPVVVVAESGISSRAQAAEAELAGADAVLVGSTLMRAPNPGAALSELLRRPLVKVCGLTRPEDVAAAAAAGADLAGFILAAESPRRADAVLQVPETMLAVAVLVGEEREVDADLVQLYGRENGHRSRDAVLLRAGVEVARVVDRPWQQPGMEHLDRVRMTPGRVMLAGGLSPENVAEAITAAEPWAVDAASSLETSPGIKDHDRVRAFVAAARR